jgi:hypothetical protein
MPVNRISLWLCGVLLFVYLLCYSGLRHSIDEKSTLAVAGSLLVEGRWHANQMEWEQLWRPSQNAFGIDGNLYSKKGLGATLAALPLFALGKAIPGAGAVQTANLTGLLLALATLYTFFRLVLVLDYPLRTAIVATTALALCTPLWIYSKTLLSEPPAALGLCLALYGVVAYRRHGHAFAASTVTAETFQEAPSFLEGLRVKSNGRHSLLIAGLGLALIVLAKPADAIVCLAFAIYVFYVARYERRYTPGSRRFWRDALAFGAPFGLGVLAMLVYNYARFHLLLSLLDPLERFSTPMWLGLTGLLFSPGKGVAWYAPLVWLIPLGVAYWREDRRKPDFWLASGAALLAFLLYSVWFDWDGGRAWGPRMIVFTMPALVVLALPMLDRFSRPDVSPVLRYGVGVLLAAALLAQLPGVFVNFDFEEERTLLAGVSPTAILWDPRHSPLATYWSAIGSSTSDPIWMHAFFWRNPPWLLGALFGGVLFFVLASSLAPRRIRCGRKDAPLWLGAQFVLLSLLAAALVTAAQNDERWHESTAQPADNRALLDFIHAHAAADDLVLLDLIPHFDIDDRTWFWTNAARLRPAYIGWLRKPEMTTAEQERLSRWLRPYDRIWLALEGTAENAPESTTEHWLDSWGYPGRRQWLGEQRIVEYINPRGAQVVTAADGVYRFGEEATLEGYTVRQADATGMFVVDLVWTETPPQPLNLSLQALTAEGALAAQLDRPVGEYEKDGKRINRLGFSVAQPFAQLVLKVYRPDNGEVLEIHKGEHEKIEHLLLYEP